MTIESWGTLFHNETTCQGRLRLGIRLAHVDVAIKCQGEHEHLGDHWAELSAYAPVEGREDIRPALADHDFRITWKDAIAEEAIR